MPRAHRSSRRLTLIAGFILACGVVGCATDRSRAFVSVPVADLRAQPGGLATAGVHDPLQETQLLYGEQVRVIKTQKGWSLVEAVEQREYTHNARWQGYPGWIMGEFLSARSRPQRANAIVTARWATVWQEADGLTPLMQLPMGTKVVIASAGGPMWNLHLIGGTSGWISAGSVEPLRRLQRLPRAARRQAILRTAEQFLGDPYVWGGRSPFAGAGRGRVTGVDCSGLVNLAYRTAGVEIPRDAHEQYLCARRITVLEPADLVFLSAPDDPATIVHVMLYAGDGWFIEGPGTGLTVRRISVTDRLGQPVKSLKPGDQINRQTVRFGAYLP